MIVNLFVSRTGVVKVQNVQVLINKLTSVNPDYRNTAAYEIKNINQPLLGPILYNCKVKFDIYTRLLGNCRINLSAYHSYGISEKVYEQFPNGPIKNNIVKCHREWLSALEGARLYLYISSDSVETGLLELLRILSNDPAHTGVVQAQYLLKYSGTYLVEPLLVHMKSPFPEIRAWTIFLISLYEDIRTYGPIKEALNDESAMVRNAAAEAVKQLKIPLNDSPKEVHREVIKEIVKIPCRYCGTFIVNTSTTCFNCGAPLNK
ncbi:MAG: HEAT repeat protein [Methanocella sp. PtaU1.Bin125]|nr:MAG: HEAT repeat protein [Methanocella sp. PtaU1.Bin125]